MSRQDAHDLLQEFRRDGLSWEEAAGELADWANDIQFQSKTPEVLSVVQLSPQASNPRFANAFLIVDEVKSWGVQGYVWIPGEADPLEGGPAFYRAKRGNYEVVGKAVWALPRDAD